MVGLTLFGSCFLSFWGFVNADDIIVQEGSSSSDLAYAVVLANGLPIIAGSTSSNFPGMTNSGSDDAIVVKYNIDGTQAAIKTLATSSDESVYGSTIDDSNNVYVTGYTDGDLAGSEGGRDIFVAKFDSSLTQLWLIQTGTDGSDSGYAVAVDSANRLIVGGTVSGTFTGQTNLGYTDCFIMQYNSSGGMEWVIQFGGSKTDLFYDLAVNTVGSVDDIYATGYTDSGTFDGQTRSGSSAAFLIKVWRFQTG